MKRKITKFLAALALLVFTMPSMVAWGQTRTLVDDVMTAASFAATSNTYTDFSGVSFTSDAVYAGNSAKTNSGGIQLRSKNSNSGIVSTSSGGTIHSVAITVESGSNTLDIYGKNTAYTSASDLYSNQTQGTKIGSISATGTVNLGDYVDQFEYIGIRSNDGAIYLTNITVTWTTSGGPQPTTHSLTFGADPAAGGSVVVGNNLTSPATVAEEAELNISATANTGYVFYNWTVTGEGSSVANATNASTTFTMGTEDATLTANFEEVETYTVTYVANGPEAESIVDTYNEGATVTVRPANTFTYAGHAFTEWNTDEEGNGNSFEAGGIIEGINGDVILFAQWEESNETVDVINPEFTGNPSNYTDWSEKEGASGAVYAGQSSGGTSYIQLRATSPSGIVSTTSGGIVRKVVVTWDSSTASGRTLNVYGRNTAYSTAADLYGDNAGELLGTIVYGTGTELTISSNYAFIGLRSNANAMYLDEIRITWEAGGTPDPSITANNLSIDCDATSGEIAFTINDGVEGGVLSTEVVGTPTIANFTLGEETTSPISFTCAANTTGNDRTATIKLTYTYGDEQTTTTNVTITQAGDPNATITIAEVRTQGTGDAATKGIITYISNKNAYIQDETAAICVFVNTNNFWTNNNYEVGDEIRVSGSLTTYAQGGNMLEITPTAANITKLSSGNELPYTVKTIEAINTDAFNALQCQYVKLENVTVTTIGENNNYTIAQGDYTIIVHGSMEVEENDVITSFFGNVGYYNGVQLVNPTDVQVQPNTDPSITVDPTTVNAPATETSGTINVTCENLGDYTLDVHFYASDGTTSLGVDDYPDWISFANLETTNATSITYYIDANSGDARSAYFTVEGLYGENQVISSDLVTINQAAPVAPPTPGTWVSATLAELTPGDVFVIVGTNDLGENYYAMSNNNGTSAPSAISVNVTDNTLSGTIADNIQWNLTVCSDGYTFYPAGSATTWLYCISNNNGLRVSDGNYPKVFIMKDNYLYNVGQERYVGIYNSQDWRSYTSINSNIANQTFAFYKKVSDDVTYTKDITAYEGNGGYTLIASPVCSVTPSADNGFLTNAYDLYYFDQSQDQEWRNHEAGAFNLTSGKGYLYANSAATQLTFTGQPYSGNGVVALDYNASAEFAGWNLIGNPFGQVAYITDSYYTIEDGDNGSEVVAGTGSAIEAMQGIFVVATEAGQNVTFSTTPAKSREQVALNVMKNRGNVIDRAIVRFGEGQQLPKFQLNPNNTKIYVTEGNQDYAVVRSAAEAEMPVSFKASENGTYTLAVETENVEMNYLHLIDNLTGMDVDLLQTPSYTFEAKTNDYTSRFRLVFKASSTSSEADETFAYYDGSSWTVSNLGEATLQVVDVTGRTVSSETINGNATISLNQTPGVYMLRLVNGNSVKVQKVVVR